MPDNNGGILGGLGNFFGGIGGPTYLANVQRQQLELAMQRYQMELLQQQMREQQGDDPNRPRMPVGQALYNIQHPEVQYGLPQYGQPIEGEGGMKVPTGYFHGQPFVGVPPGPNAPQSVGQATASQNSGGASVPQAVPGVGGPATGGVPSALQQAQPYFDYFRNQKAQTEAAVTKSKAEAEAQPAFPGALTTAQNTISRLEALKNDPRLPLVVGGLQGRSRAIAGPQADIVNEINTLQGKILADTYSQLRTISHRSVNAGALKDLSAGLGDLISGRVGTIPAYQKSIDDAIGQIKEETEAAWEAQGGSHSGIPKPTWGATSTQANPTPTFTHIQQLKLNPGRRNEFDAKFGNGAAARYLGQ